MFLPLSHHLIAVLFDLGAFLSINNAVSGSFTNVLRMPADLLN